jgi:predicted DNA-binding transcriptional regulator AlpA
MQPLIRTTSSRDKPLLPSSEANQRSPAAPNRRLLKIEEVCAVVGVSRAMIYKSMKRRSAPFPKPVKIGAVSRWPVEDVENWVSELRNARGRAHDTR